ncbi:uncharacterized protein PODANS_4_1055 [Podospora anserina S mat+]|uniref:Podospora anserina S mat+ genomic DNA chromosome 4, supercontig 1 n=1 Tax=Podospora anserina (strain S / ATCC MYA-4624 / DSM 980 / FGSC 10383) TaxID=515849 RepID=B2ADG6_PODAN|nr:uncharacterized protein PODANS_4_1055 [Podospora anserina S mat+]CAP61481.1 unnamed protein product [Podospora anserina S mat+]CDP27835.1 Putative protein of unknown function [Podospora anserina S mat+]
MSHNDDRVEAFTKTFESAIEAAISKQFTDLVSAEFRRMNNDQEAEIQRLEENFQQEKSRFLTIAKAAAGGKISQDKLEVLADRLLRRKEGSRRWVLFQGGGGGGGEGGGGGGGGGATWFFGSGPDPGGPNKRAHVGFAAERAGHAFGDESPALAGVGRAVRKRVEIKNRDVSDWESEGQDDIFEDLELGIGWIVLRCDLGADVAPVKFTEDPFAVPGRLAERHFDGFEKCVKHDHRRVYTNEDSLREFGHRGEGFGRGGHVRRMLTYFCGVVVDAGGSAPSLEWVLAAN